MKEASHGSAREPRPGAGSDSPRLSAGRVIAVAIITGIAGGVISALAGRWLHDKIVLAVVGGVAVGLLTLVLSRPRSKRP